MKKKYEYKLIYMNIFQINDTRLIFSDYTFSNYKKNQVIQQLEKNLLCNKLEESCHWSVELILSGHFVLLLDFILSFYCKYIHIHNPNFIHSFLHLKKKFLFICENYTFNPLEMRNNSEVRYLFGVLIMSACLSKKITCTDIPKINQEELHFNSVSYKLKSKSFYLQSIELKEDNKELIKILNEMVESILKKNINETLYWFNWIIQWEKNMKKNKIVICNPRKINNIEVKYERDVIWIIWYIILYLCKQETQKKQILNLLELYIEEFNKHKKHQKICIINVALLMLIENYNMDEPILKEKMNIESIHCLYEEIYKTYIMSYNIESINERKSIKEKKTTIDKEDSMYKLSLVDKLFNSYF